MCDSNDFEYLKFKYDRPDLHEVFGMAVDTFSSHTDARVTGEITLWELLQKIQYNLGNDITPAAMLTDKYVNGKKNPEYDALKAELPAVCYNARFNGYKDLDHLISPANLMFLDVDDFDTREEAEAYRYDITNRYGWIVSCSLSLSRLGLHIVIRVDSIIDNDDFNYKYDFISDTYFNGRLDKNGKSLTRFAIVPYDFNIYINENPIMLEIDRIIRSNKGGTPSAYISGDNSTSNNDEKGISSAYKEDISNSSNVELKGTPSAYEEEEGISSPCTFFAPSPVNELMNHADGNYGLRFEQQMDGSRFTDPDTPVYVREGVDVIRVNLYPYRTRKVKVGHRSDFIGSVSMQMIHLNAGSSGQTDNMVKKSILKFILSINKRICDPPLPYKEVLKSFNSNWKKFESGKLDVSKFLRKKYAFWSPDCTLKASEKRRITCKISNAPTVDYVKRRIRAAIEAIIAAGGKVTQRKVAETSGMPLSTLKNNYRGYYREVLNGHVSSSKYKGADESICDVVPDKSNNTSDDKATTNRQEPAWKTNIKDGSINESDGTMKIANIEEIALDDDPPGVTERDELVVADAQLKELYANIYGLIINEIGEHHEQELFTRFVSLWNELPECDKKLLMTPMEDLDDDQFWNKPVLESKFRQMSYEYYNPRVNK